MNLFSNMVQKFTIKPNKKINHFCEPIKDNFGVSHFWYYTITNDAQYGYIGSHAAWAESYFGENQPTRCPYLRSADNFNSGTGFISMDSDASMTEGSIKFNINQALLLIEKTPTGIEGFGFASQLNKKLFQSLCVNEMPLLRLFAKVFKDKFQKNILDLKDYYVDLRAAIGPTFYKRNPQCLFPTADRENFLDKLEFSAYLQLSRREKTLLPYVAQGLFASEIAQELHLSKRSIEHYIDAIKNKLNCCSKHELAQKLRDFLALGYCIPL